jgi:hypothetical protein
VLSDPFTESLTVHFSAAMQPGLQGALIQAANGLSSGNLVEVADGLLTAEAISATASTPDDLALAAVLQLMLNHAQTLLNL